MNQIKILSTIMFFLALPTYSTSEPLQEQSIRKRDVPKIVLETFQKSYPNALIKGYSKEVESGSLVYEIESSEGKVHRDVTYRPDGAVVSVEETLPFGELPEAVQASVKKEFPGAVASICERIIKASMIQYELVLKSAKESHEVVFDPEGKIVQREAVKGKME